LNDQFCEGKIMLKVNRCLVLIAFVGGGLTNAISLGQPAAPLLSSRAGAPYTMYLNFSGFSYTGTWGSGTPGITPAYNGQTGPSFTAAEQANIRSIWTRIAEAYSPFNVNVTTVDPAVAAGQAGTDLQRQTYYDATPRVMHTVIGDGSSSFYGSAGGVSFVNVWSTTQTGGRGTNWAFVNRLGGAGSLHNIFTATAHEMGHAAGLSHQGDYIGSTRVNEYSRNNNSTVIAPIMGVGYSAERNVWRVGRISTNVNTIQNDVGRMLASNPGMGLFNDGIGRTLATATPLAIVENQIDFENARGVIVPLTTSNPNPIGADNYSKGIFSFSTAGGLNTITVNAGGQWLVPGFADPRPMLDATLRILDQSGLQIAISNTASLSETLAVNLTAGSYFIEVSSAGGKQASLGPDGNWVAAQFFDMGSYFLTGNIIAVPEPNGALLLFAFWGLCAIRRNRAIC
jgi:hypothetical protein